MITNTEIKPWRSTEEASRISASWDAVALADREIAALRTALQSAHTRIEDLTTAANRCINDALMMGQQGDGELPPLPGMDGLQDIPHALQTPEDWDADYRATWQKLQVAERNKMQWRAYALKLRGLLAQHPVSASDE